MKKNPGIVAVISEVALGLLLVLMLPFVMILIGLPVVLAVRAAVALASQF